MRTSPWLIGIVAAPMLLVSAMESNMVQAQSAASSPNMAATVNGQDIPLARVSQLSMEMAGPGVLDQLIGNLLVDQEAKKRGITVTDVDVDAELDRVREAVKPQTLAEAMREHHTTLDAFRDDLRVQLELHKLLAEKQAGDEQIAAFAPKYVASLRDAGKVVVYLGGNAAGPVGIAATVNGENISTARVADLALRTSGPTIADRLIDNALIDQEARKAHIVVTPSQIDARIAAIRTDIKPKTLDTVLRENHLTMVDLRELQRVRAEAETLIAKSVHPIKTAHLRHILVLVKQHGASNLPSGTKSHSKSEALAIIAKIQRELKAGKPFATLAKRYSEDPGSKDRGGDLGIVTQKTPFDPAFAKAAFALKRGEITATAVESADGLHLIEADSTEIDHPRSENAAYRAAEQQAKEREVQAEMHDFVPSLRARGHVINYLAP